MRNCANCHKPIGLNTRSLPRKWDWRALCWRVFHHRQCKREWMHKQAEDRDKEIAVHRLFHPPSMAR